MNVDDDRRRSLPVDSAPFAAARLVPTAEERTCCSRSEDEEQSLAVGNVTG